MASWTFPDLDYGFIRIGRHLGTVTREADGQWSWVCLRNPQPAEQGLDSGTCASRTEAQQKVEETLGDTAQGLWVG